MNLSKFVYFKGK